VHVIDAFGAKVGVAVDWHVIVPSLSSVMTNGPFSVTLPVFFTTYV